MPISAIWGSSSQVSLTYDTSPTTRALLAPLIFGNSHLEQCVWGARLQSRVSKKWLTCTHVSVCVHLHLGICVPMSQRVQLKSNLQGGRVEVVGFRSLACLMYGATRNTTVEAFQKRSQLCTQARLSYSSLFGVLPGTDSSVPSFCGAL